MFAIHADVNNILMNTLRYSFLNSFWLISCSILTMQMYVYTLNVATSFENFNNQRPNRGGIQGEKGFVIVVMILFSKAF